MMTKREALYMMPRMIPRDASLADYEEDLAGLADHAASAADKVRRFLAGLRASPEHYRPETHAHLVAEAERLLASLEKVSVRLNDALACAEAWTEADFSPLRETKRACADLLRTLHAQMGFVLSAGDWQSPSYLHTFVPQAGKRTGKITGTVNDYTRDGHPDASVYERAFASAYVDAPLRFPPHVFATGSGMSAFSTVLFLLSNAPDRGPVLVGASSSFENQWALRRAFRDDVHLVDETDTAAILEAAERLKPSAVFLDTLCNAPTLAMPDLATLLPELERLLPKGAAIVLDNSTRAIACQPLQYLPRFGRRTRLFVLESLNKYHQFGFDRVTGGIVWTTGGFADSGLADARKHLGTTMPDATALALPAPNRLRLEERLKRINRNALMLATRLQAHLDRHPSALISHVVYPGLPSHPSHAWTKDGFQGGSLILAPTSALTNVLVAKRFIGRAIEEGRREEVEIMAGTSFGFDATRLYLTAMFATDISKPFLRVSAGTESMREAEGIGNALVAALERP
jgi:cystathionine beta-lyase/cystathionine gamma-synthase